MRRSESLPAEEQSDAVRTQGAAILQEQTLVNTLASVILLALELGIKGLYQQAIGLLLGDDVWVLRDELQVGAVVIALEMRKLLCKRADLNVGGVIIVIGLLSLGCRLAGSTRVQQLNIGLLARRSSSLLLLGGFGNM